MSQTFANTINSNPIYAKRAECDAAGNTLSTTYATKSELPESSQLVPSATSADADKVLTVDSLGFPGWAVVPSQPTGLFQATYGTTTYNEVRDAVTANKIVYCYVSGRMAFLAYVGSTNYEFQYYRSNSSSSGTDSIFVYKVYSSGWETTERTVKAGNISYPVTQVNVNGSSAMTGTVANITIPAAPTVDQTYDATSSNAQSGTAVAEAVSTKQDTISDLATIRSEAAAGATAVQPSDLATVATTGDYSDLSGTPSIPTATSDLTNDSGFITLSDVPAQVNADWNSSSGASEILNKPTIPSGAQLVPAATSADADKVLTVDSQGTPAWASAQAPISAGTGIDITNNVVSVDTSVVATQTDLADKEDAFDVGTGLEMDTSGATPTLQVEAPVDIVAGPGIIIDNPDGNTLRVSVAQDYNKVLWSGTAATSANVSESIFNFERCRMVIQENDATNTVAECEFEIVPGTTTYDVIALYYGGSSNPFQMETAPVTITNDGTTVSIGTVIRRYFPASTGAGGSDSNTGKMTKIVGIHRIANN